MNRTSGCLILRLPNTTFRLRACSTSWLNSSHANWFGKCILTTWRSFGIRGHSKNFVPSFPSRSRKKTRDEMRLNQSMKKRSHDAPLGEEGRSFSEKRVPPERSGCKRRVRRPRKAAKAAGTPNSEIVTWLVVGTEALRANRSSHARREWARCARERMTSGPCGSGGRACGSVTSTRWSRSKRIQARRCCLRLQSCHRRGADPI